MDLVREGRKEQLFEKRKAQLEEKAGNFKVTAFPTSIWEVTLYKAWTEIVASLTYNMDKLKDSLTKYVRACRAEEVILFEKDTFLLICYQSNKEVADDQRFEKISHIIKKFKLSCMTAQARFRSIFIQTKNLTIYLDEFTQSTCIMVIASDRNVNVELLRLNAKLSRDTFEEIINGSGRNSNPN